MILDRRRAKLDCLAFVLFFATVFLALSLLSYDPADPPGATVYPPNRAVLNLCGPAGALAADLLFQAVGIGAFALLVGLAAVDVLLFTRTVVSDRWLRGIGAALMLGCSIALLAHLAPLVGRGPLVGSGGYLGTAVDAVLERYFSTVGTYLILVPALLCGAFLACDYILFRLIQLLMVLLQARRLIAWSGSLSLPSLPRWRLGRLAAPAAPVDAAPGEALPVATTARIDAILEPLAPRPPSDLPHPGHSAAEAHRELTINGPVRRSSDVTDDYRSPDGSDGFNLPGLELLEPPAPFPYEEHEVRVREKADILVRTLADFGYRVQVVQIDTGPVITQFEIQLEAGLRVGKIKSLADDLAIAFKVPSVRIVAPILGRSTVGIEVPNDRRGMVRLREVIEGIGAHSLKHRISLYLGKDVKGNPLAFDLTEMPHLLIAGRTGTGKSVCLNAIILSILMTRRPDEVKLLLIDPKMVELSQYKRIPHLIHPVVTDMKKAETILAWAVDKMEERYDLLRRAGVRHVSTYNSLGAEEIYSRLKPMDDQERAQIPVTMPYVVIVADEMADLMMTAAKEVEGHIIRLAQKSRAVGIHLVLATQKPTVDVITGLIKSNLPARIAFQVASRTDSRVVLDEIGSEKLLGNGDMLFLIPGTSQLVRAQATFVSDREVAGVVDFLEANEPQFYKELIQLNVTGGGGSGDAKKGGPLKNRDELYEQAIEITIREGRGSTSLLQRALGIGYGRASRLIDFMAEDGIVGEYNGSQAREVLYSLEEWEGMRRDAGAKGAGNDG